MKLNDPRYVAPQYKDSTHVDVRINFHKRFGTNKYSWQQWVFDHLLDLPPRSRLLELGCGPGALWEENLQRIPPGWDITLSDFSPGMVAGIRLKLERLHPFQFKVIDAQSIPFEDASFDAVIANHMLFHVPDLPAALQEIRRVLKPQGRLFAATNGQRHLAEMADLLVRFDPAFSFWSASDTPFRLETGAAELSPCFTDIQVHKYEDAAEVNEVAPLVDYILSGRLVLEGERLEQFRQFVTQEMASHGGCIHITKSAGLFVCVRKED